VESRPLLSSVSGEIAADLGELAKKVLARCDALAECSECKGAITRTFLSPAMDACNFRVSEWMKAAGMRVNVDRAGNLRGYYPAHDENDTDLVPRLMMGSHLDSVPDGGRYDGVLGVMLGIGLVEALEGRHFGFGIEVIGFSEEEGVRYGFPFIGSRALTATLHAPHLARRDANGVAMFTALDNYAAAHPGVIDPEFHMGTSGYLEFHIEQGPMLEHAGLGLGVVETIAGQSRVKLTFRGRSGHAGTTPMFLRHDALAAAAEWILAVESAAGSAPGLVATTGQISCQPGAANVISGIVSCSLDVRHGSDEIRRSAVEDFLALARAIAERRQIEVDHLIEYEQPAVHLDPALIAIADKAVSDAGISPRHMASGAGHDAMIIAPKIPAAMIFLRSPGGISHHPDEAVLTEDVESALQAGMNFLHLFQHHIDQPIEREPDSCTT